MGLFDMLPPIGGGSGGPSSMNESERRAFILQMLEKLGGGGGDLGPGTGYDTLAPRFFPQDPNGNSGVKVGQGQKELSPELAGVADIGQGFGGAASSAPSLPIDQLQGLLGAQGAGMSPEEMDALEQLLSEKMNVLAQRGMR